MVSHGGAVGVFAWVDKGEGLSWFEGWGIGMVLCGIEGIGKVYVAEYIATFLWKNKWLYGNI